MFTPNLGEDEPILTSIFFRWVEIDNFHVIGDWCCSDVFWEQILIYYSSNEYPGGFEYVPKRLPQYLGVEDEPRCAHSFSTGFKLKPGHVVHSEPPKGKG